MKKVTQLVITAALAAASQMTFAADPVPVDYTAVKSTILASITDVGTIGLACLSVVVAVVAFTWVRRVLK
ncbi:major capsid protein [Pseudomonas lundensis]|uniref:major capsid protein n=1 Tax=Pseudomonas lundensis TaxID=86185 RepID=UPI000653F631|nr:major capsid protein [Pseudomonas lundensis]KMM87396.1 hypothetical protein TU74_17965 [Pseudomonas lundensis]NNA22273.1 hypothetical protein [Pseudomonas lundensis]